jgi:hypothetical protein
MKVQRSLWDPWDDFWEKPRWFDDTMGGPGFPTGGPTAVDDSAIEDLAAKHHIGFVVLDGAGEPYPGLAYVLEGPQEEREEGVLGADAQVRRDDVHDDDYRFELKSVVDVVWTREAADCGEEIGLAGTVIGYEDGTAVEIRIFRERRETDDDVVDTVDATVEGGVVQAVWSYDPNDDKAVPGTHAQLAFIAQLRIDGEPTWAKTLQPVRVTLPRVAAAQWSRRATAPGKTVQMRVKMVGLPDGSPVTVEVFKQLRSSDTELLTTLEGIAVADRGVEVPWVYEHDPSDPASGEAECLFVVTSELYLDVTKTSGPLWVSSTVGSKRKRSPRKRKR